MNNLVLGIALLASTTSVDPSLVEFDNFCQKYNGEDVHNLGAVRKLYLHQPIDHTGTHYYKAIRVPFVRLVVNPEKFDNKLIRIKGNLNKYGQKNTWISQEIGLDGQDNVAILELSKYFKGLESYQNGSIVEAIGIFRLSKVANSRVLGVLSEASIRILGPIDGAKHPIEFSVVDEFGVKKRFAPK